MFIVMFPSQKWCFQVKSKVSKLISVSKFDILTIWKDNLGDLSREIRHLQDQSTSMGIKLNNRRSVREYLSQLVDELLIPEEMIEVRVQKYERKILIVWVIVYE